MAIHFHHAMHCYFLQSQTFIDLNKKKYCNRAILWLAKGVFDFTFKKIKNRKAKNCHYKRVRPLGPAGQKKPVRYGYARTPADAAPGVWQPT